MLINHSILLIDPMAFEALCLALVLVLAIIKPSLGSGLLNGIEEKFRSVASRQSLSVILAGLLAFGSSAAVSLFVQMPVPRAHDEFSYLLSADTFAHGRVSNPTHPMWKHFESFHVFHEPTYASKYPPGQGLVLALGQVVTGKPIAGVWISMGLAAAAICWMLQAWTSPSWALLGSLLATFRFGFVGFAAPAEKFGYWGQSYWGGAVAALGGAMVFGAYRRVLEEPERRHALAMGIGLSVLANSRPFEGLLVSLPVLAALLLWAIRQRELPFKKKVKTVFLPLVCVLAATAAAMGYYHYRVTGNPLQMPYFIHENTYSLAPVFLWQHPRAEPPYHHAVMREFHTGWPLIYYQNQRSVAAFLGESIQKIKNLWAFYLGILLSLPLMLFPKLLRDRWTRFATASLCLLLAGLLSETVVLPHYAAPAAALIFAVVMEGMKRLKLCQWRGQSSGLFCVRCIPIVCLLSAFVPLAKNMGNDLANWSFERQRILEELNQKPGKHLVIVRYGAQHDLHAEWVYTDAEINDTKVIWARGMEQHEDFSLMNYFRDRNVWLLEPDKAPIRLLPVDPGLVSASELRTPKVHHDTSR